MDMRKTLTAAVLAAALVFSSCTASETGMGVEATQSPPETTTPANPSSQAPQENLGPTHIDNLVAEMAGSLAAPGMSEFEMARAAFDWIVEANTLGEPLGLDLWRVRGPGDPIPSFVENRSLSVLLWNTGMCEDYSAALTLILRGMGLNALYMPGLTYAADGSGFVNHAWTMVEIDGVWYHLDSQLEQNVTRQGRLRYRYFLKGDETMFASHRWGQNLIDTRLLSDAQNEEVAQGFLPPPAPQDFPTPAIRNFEPPLPPNRASIEAAIAAEVAAFEEVHGPLPPLDLNVIPPVFGTAGFPA